MWFGSSAVKPKNMHKTTGDAKVAASFRSVWKMPLIMAVFTLIAATSSFAGEVTLTTIVPDSGEYVYGRCPSGGGGETWIWESTAEPVLSGAVYWKAPKTGTILVTWHLPRLLIMAQGETPGGSFGFFARLDGMPGAFDALRRDDHLAAVCDVGQGNVFYQPLVDKWAVTKGVQYEITLYYFADLTNCFVTVMGSTGTKSRYVNTP